MEPLGIPGAWSVTPRIHTDDRGSFHEWFRTSDLTSVLGYRLDVAQANCSVSRRGVLRGVHFADVPPGQAKYVTCVSGAILDVVVDIRVGSPTFGQWEALRLDDANRRAVFLAEGLGHAFMALTDQATVLYLCSTPYVPSREHGVHPLDPELGIAWPADLEPVLSAKDAAAPSLAQARAAGLLPDYAELPGLRRLAAAARRRRPARPGLSTRRAELTARPAERRSALAAAATQRLATRLGSARCSASRQSPIGGEPGPRPGRMAEHAVGRPRGAAGPDRRCGSAGPGPGRRRAAGTPPGPARTRWSRRNSSRDRCPAARPTRPARRSAPATSTVQVGCPRWSSTTCDVGPRCAPAGSSSRTKLLPCAPYSQAVRTTYPVSPGWSSTACSPASLVRPYAVRGAVRAVLRVRLAGLAVEHVVGGRLDQRGAAAPRTPRPGPPPPAR